MLSFILVASKNHVKELLFSDIFYMDEFDLLFFSDLFWTPPEILKTGVYHLDHVGYGTKEGDVYR